MRNVSKLTALCLSLFAAAGAMQPLHAAKAVTTAAKSSSSAKQAQLPADRVFCSRYEVINSRIVHQGCKTKADWELMGMELLVRK